MVASMEIADSILFAAASDTPGQYCVFPVAMAIFFASLYPRPSKVYNSVFVRFVPFSTGQIIGTLIGQ